MQNYTGHGWEGTKYAAGVRLYGAELSKAIRKDLKEAMPECKFSVTKETYSGGQSVSIALMEAPYEVLNPGEGYYQVNQYHLDSSERMTEKGKEIMRKAIGIAKSYNYDDSDGMIDYFSTNFYLHPTIGKWGKSFKKI